MLSGNLSEFPLLRLLETLMGAARGGALFIEHPHFSGRIYLYGGYPVHAEAGSLRGLDALELLAGIQSAPFRFESETQTQERSIEPSLETHNLIALIALAGLVGRLVREFFNGMPWQPPKEED